MAGERRLRALDVFAGVGGWSLGLAPAGIDVVCAVEQEPWKWAIHRAAWPDVPVFRDIRKVTGDAVRRAAGGIDIVVGSPPCQDASAANARGRGIDGAETGLFREAVRLVRELRPRWVALENSPRLRTRGVDRVLGWLEEAGYAVWPLVVGADDLGAPHERKRLWIVAHAAGEHGRGGRADGRGPALDPGAGHADRARPPERQGLGRDLVAQLAASERAAWLLDHPWAGGLVRHLRVADELSAGVPSRLLADCRSAYGDAVVPAVVEAVGRAIVTADGRPGP